MKELHELLEKFRSDETWNTPNHDGTQRFDKKLIWLENMIMDYSKKLNIPIDDVVRQMESKRTYSWPNYYQEANFPVLDSENLIGVFKTFDEFNAVAKEKYRGFLCPKCGSIGEHPQECWHRVAGDGKCDWCSYGLISSSVRIIVLESGFKAIPIFEPILKEYTTKSDLMQAVLDGERDCGKR